MDSGQISEFGEGILYSASGTRQNQNPNNKALKNFYQLICEAINESLEKDNSIQKNDLISFFEKFLIGEVRYDSSQIEQINEKIKSFNDDNFLAKFLELAETNNDGFFRDFKNFFFKQYDISEFDDSKEDIQLQDQDSSKDKAKVKDFFDEDKINLIKNKVKNIMNKSSVDKVKQQISPSAVIMSINTPTKKISAKDFVTEGSNLDKDHNHDDEIYIIYSSIEEIQGKCNNGDYGETFNDRFYEFRSEEESASRNEVALSPNGENQSPISQDDISFDLQLNESVSVNEKSDQLQPNQGKSEENISSRLVFGDIIPLQIFQEGESLSAFENNNNLLTNRGFEINNPVKIIEFNKDESGAKIKKKAVYINYKENNNSDSKFSFSIYNESKFYEENFEEGQSEVRKKSDDLESQLKIKIIEIIKDSASEAGFIEQEKELIITILKLAASLGGVGNCKKEFMEGLKKEDSVDVSEIEKIYNKAKKFSQLFQKSANEIGFKTGNIDDGAKFVGMRLKRAASNDIIEHISDENFKICNELTNRQLPSKSCQPVDCVQLGDPRPLRAPSVASLGG